MSLVNLSYICSHLQNVSRARVGFTSVMLSKLHLRLILSLQKQGFVSNVCIGGEVPPDTFFDTHTIQHSTLGFQSFDPAVLAKEPWRAYPDPDSKYAQTSPHFPTYIPENPARRRIWIGLKYSNELPALRKLNLISKPSCRIVLKWKELLYLTQGLRQGRVDGIINPGECIFVSTDRGLFESRECVERRIGGLALCRAL